MLYWEFKEKQLSLHNRFLILIIVLFPHLWNRYQSITSPESPQPSFPHNHNSHLKFQLLGLYSYYNLVFSKYWQFFPQNRPFSFWFPQLPWVTYTGHSNPAHRSSQVMWHTLHWKYSGKTQYKYTNTDIFLIFIVCHIISITDSGAPGADNGRCPFHSWHILITLRSPSLALSNPCNVLTRSAWIRPTERESAKLSDGLLKDIWLNVFIFQTHCVEKKPNLWLNRGRS